MTDIALYLLCITLSALGGLMILRFARNGRMIDVPGERSSHRDPMPTGGGVGILSAFLFSALYLRVPPGVWFPSAILALVSLYGDWFKLSPHFRLSVQFLAVAVFVFSFVPSAGSANGAPFIVFFFLFASVYIVGTANFFNFMDGIDGMLALSSAVSFGFAALFVYTEGGDPLYFRFALCLAAACLGFLPLNFPRAKVFMGDVGSILIGFLYGGLVIILSGSPLDFAVLSGCAGLIYADVLTTLFIRWRRGENLLLAHRRHLYQVLANERGVAHWKISVLYGMVQIILGSLLFLVKPYGFFSVTLLLLLFFTAFVFFGSHIRRRAAENPAVQPFGD
ncbi:MAG TPA: glycosyltransferase family 4 protein [Syntrophales bacterium]|nr:glycosyltransferase family 4 protein [Syntrophales bacterium]